MNKLTDNERDESVGKAYRAFSTETVPDDVNRRVLREAASGEQAGFWQRFYSWRRPLAFAATLVLGISLVYDMQIVLRDTGAPLLPAVDGANREDELLENEARYDDSTRTLPAEAAPVTQAPARFRASPDQAASGNTASKFSVPSSVEADLPQDTEQREERSRSHEQLGKRQSAPAVSAERAAPTADAAEARTMYAPPQQAQPDCSDARDESPYAWWRCIQVLRSAGHAALADDEWQQLLKRYPDFRAPPSPDQAPRC